MTKALQDTSNAPADADLIRQHLAGDDQAFGVLLERYRRPLFGYLARFTGDSALADDVFQETFLQVHQSAPMFDLAKPFRPWLYTVATNKARDALRRKYRHAEAPLDAPVSAPGHKQTTFADLLPADIPEPDAFSLNLETTRAVEDMIEQMPSHLREVLILSYFQELPHKDIAEILSVPVGTVKSRLHAAIRQFAEKWTVWASRQENPRRHDPGQ